MKAVYFESPRDFRAWLDAHHARATELLVGFHKRKTSRPSMTWPESVDEALCFGWIDGVRRRVDDDRYTIRFTPRKAGSHWSNVNVARVAVLEEEGRMRDAGRAAFAKRDARKTGNASYEQRPPDLGGERLARLAKNAKALAYWKSAAPWYRRAATWWVVSAKKEETREKRLATLIADCAAGRRIGPMKYATKK